jgi:hypothetical protein
VRVEKKGLAHSSSLLIQRGELCGSINAGSACLYWWSNFLKSRLFGNLPSGPQRTLCETDRLTGQAQGAVLRVDECIGLFSSMDGPLVASGPALRPPSTTAIRSRLKRDLFQKFGC